MQGVFLTVLIPCLNEENTIRRAVKEAWIAGKNSGYKYEVVVADNGSTDGTLKILKEQKIARIIKVPIKGYGAALHYGIISAKGKCVIFADADLSYRFSDLEKFLKLINGNYDLILGSRFKGKIEPLAMPFLNRYLGTPVLTWLIRWLYGIKTSDCNSGMRMIKRDYYLRLGMKNAGMEWASELLIKTAKNGGKYGEVPISFGKDKREKAPHLLPWADGWRHLKAIILLKPIIILLGAGGSGIMAAMTFQRSDFWGRFFLIIGVTLVFTYLSAVILNNIANGDDKNSNKLLEFSNPAVVIIGFGTLLLMVANGTPLVDKITWLSIIIIYSLWVFLVETIKTHLINTLPGMKIK